MMVRAKSCLWRFFSRDASVPYRAPAQKISPVMPGTLMPTHFQPPTVYLGEAKWKFYILQCIPLTPYLLATPSLPPLFLQISLNFFLEECVTRLRDHYLDHLSGSGALSSLGCGVSSYTVQQFNNAQIK